MDAENALTDVGGGMNRLVLLTSRKGGTGKTTAAACLAAAAAQSGVRTLLCDLDFFNHSADLLLGCESDVLFDLSDLAAGRGDAEKCTLPVPGCEGLFLLPAPVMDGDAPEPDAVRAAIREAAQRRECALIIADTHSDTDPITVALAPESDLILSVTTPEAASLRGSEALAAALDAAGARRIKLLINRFDPEAVLAGQGAGLREMIDRTHTELFGVVPESAELRAGGAVLPGRGGPADPGGAYGRMVRRLNGETAPLFESLPAKKRRRLLGL